MASIPLVDDKELRVHLSPCSPERQASLRKMLAVWPRPWLWTDVDALAVSLQVHVDVDTILCVVHPRALLPTMVKEIKRCQDIPWLAPTPYYQLTHQFFTMRLLHEGKKHLLTLSWETVKLSPGPCECSGVAKSQCFRDAKPSIPESQLGQKHLNRSV